MLFRSAELQDALQSTHIEGKGKADFTQFVPEEGVEVEYLNLHENTKEITIPMKNTFKFKAKINDDVSFSGSLENMEITVDAKNDADWLKLDLRNVLLKIAYNSNATGKIQVGLSDATDSKALKKVKEAFENGQPCEKSFTLGKVPIVGIPGMRVYVSIGVEYVLQE